MEIDSELTVESARELLRSGDVAGRQFELLRFVSLLLSSDQATRSAGRELVIRIMDRLSEFSPMQEMLDALLVDSGLYSYVVEPSELGTANLLALEVHRPLNFVDEQVIFHPVQARAYRALLTGKSVVLSAPTSFGKSLVLDAVLRSGRFDNIAVIVPTLALIDEVRRRLARLNSGHKVISHPSQALAERNVLVMTQERLLELDRLPPLDLYMIDEFYKLDLPDEDVDRSVLLNQAFRRLRATEAPFYLAGPNVQQLAEGLPAIFEASFISTDYATVAVDVTTLPTPKRKDREAALVDLCTSLSGPTLIYCSSPGSAREAARALLQANLGQETNSLRAAAEWVGREFHPDWLLAKAMPQGIGIHHGKLPRALAQFQVDAFNAGDLKWLVCTSTLIEGVNTSAKNVVMYSHRIGRRLLDYFSFSNIKGRSGRMRRHYVGNVYIFNPSPEEDLPTVDIPLYSQGDLVPSSLLVQLDEDELKTDARNRIEDVLQQADVPVDVLRANAGVDPRAQIAMARYIDGRLNVLANNLAWSGYPTYDQLLAACQLVVQFLNPISGMSHGVATASQLAFKLNLARSVQGDMRELIIRELANARGVAVDNADLAVEAVLDFMRHWPGFAFPRLLMTLESIVKPRLRRIGLDCDYSTFGALCLNLFLSDHMVMLEEYGFPAQSGERIASRLRPYTDLDSLLNNLRSIDPSSLGDDFEESLLARAQEAL